VVQCGETIMIYESLLNYEIRKKINNIRKFTLDEINQAIDLLKQGQIVGKGVIIP
jgi:D-arabinose 1-dehydrogenase-like Zn-dependent alcohol dehydrogenase